MAAGEYLPPVVTRLSMDISDFAAKIAEAKALLKGLEGAVNIKTDGLDAAAAKVTALAKSLNGLSGTVKVNTDGLGAMTAKTVAAGAATAAATRLMWGGWMLTGNAIHWVIAGGAELLAVTLPALVALGAGLAVAAQGGQNVYQHMSSLYTATEATGNMFHTTAGMVLGMGHALQSAQDAANPSVYGILGAAIITVKEHFGGLAQTGLQVVQMFQTFAAKVAMEFGPGGSLGGMTNQLLAHMTSDLRGIGQLFGNLLHGILSFASQMPGLAEVLLGSLAGLTGLAAKAIEFAGNFRLAGLSVLTLAMGFEEFNRWGGLLATTLTRVGLASASLTGGAFSFARFGSVVRGLLSVFPMAIAQLAKFAAVAGADGAAKGLTNMATGLAGVIEKINPGVAVAVTVAAVAIGFLVDKLITARTPAQQFADDLQRVTMRATNANAFNTIANNIQQLNGVLAKTPPLVNENAGVALRLAGQWQEVNGAVGQLHAGISQQVQDFRNVSSGAAYLAQTYHVSLVTAMLLADAAGVKLAQGITGQGQAAAIARMQIAALVQGYLAMGAPLSAVGSDILALSIQSGLASTKVSSLNQAWDQFMQNITGGSAGLAALNTSLANLSSGTNNVTTILGRTSAVSLSVKNFANDLKSYSGNGAAAWTNFTQVVGQTAPQLIDWMRTAGAEGALSGAQFKQGVLDMASALVPLAANSKTAQTDVLALVAQVDPSITTWGALKKAIKDSGASLQGLGPIIDGATGKMGNMSKVAQALGTATDTALANILSQAKITASGVGGAMVAYEQALMNGSKNTDKLRANVIADLEKIGYSYQQAAGIANAAIASIPTNVHTNVTISVIESATNATGTKSGGILPTPRGYAAGTSGATPGWAWVGEAGPELVRFRGGETVVPSHVATGYAGGAGDMPTSQIHLYIDGREITNVVARRSVQTQRRTGHNGMERRTR